MWGKLMGAHTLLTRGAAKQRLVASSATFVDVLLRDLQVLDARLRGGVAGHFRIQARLAISCCRCAVGRLRAPAFCATEAGKMRIIGRDAAWTDGLITRRSPDSRRPGRAGYGSETLSSGALFVSCQWQATYQGLPLSQPGESAVLSHSWSNHATLSRASRRSSGAHNPGLLGSTPRPATVYPTYEVNLRAGKPECSLYLRHWLDSRRDGTFAAVAWTVTRRMFVHLAGA